MPNAKYFESVSRTLAERRNKQHATLAPFNFANIASPCKFAAAKSTFSQKLLKPIYALSRRWFPVFKLAGFYHITRDADVRQILLRPGDLLKRVAAEIFLRYFGLSVDDSQGLACPFGLHMRRTYTQPADDGRWLFLYAQPFGADMDDRCCFALPSRWLNAALNYTKASNDFYYCGRQPLVKTIYTDAQHAK